MGIGGGGPYFLERIHYDCLTFHTLALGFSLVLKETGDGKREVIFERLPHEVINDMNEL